MAYNIIYWIMPNFENLTQARVQHTLGESGSLASVPAAKRQKNAAYGASHGKKRETKKPQRGERPLLAHMLKPTSSRSETAARPLTPMFSRFCP